MHRKMRRFIGVCLVVVMLVGATGVVNAGSVYGSIYGYNGGGTVTTTSSSITARAFAQPESSTEPDIEVSLDGAAYKADGTELGYVRASGYGSCTDTTSKLSNVSYSLCDFYIGGYFIGTARG